MTSKLPVSVLIMTQNEEANIKSAVESVLPHFDQVIVTDSFSTDQTVDILKNYARVELYRHEFTSWADQRNWMLTNCAIRNEIVFFLDADEYVDDRLVNELAGILRAGTQFSAISLDREFIFLNRKLFCSHGHPVTARIFKKASVSFLGEGAREYAVVPGPTIRMRSPYIHHDRNPLSVWMRKHNNNSTREAALYLSSRKAPRYPLSGSLSFSPGMKLWMRTHVWDRLPLLARPFLYFPYRYLTTLAFLEGVPALAYTYLHALWYQSLIDIKIIDLTSRRDCAPRDGAGISARLDSSRTKLAVTVLIMTQNEEANIRYAMDSVLPDFDQVIVTDSFSTDRTMEILCEYSGIEVCQHAFASWADQRNWMLANCKIRNNLVFFLDADEYVTPDFVQELRRILASGAAFSSIRITPHFIFMNKHLHYAYGHPKIQRIFAGQVRFLGIGAREYAAWGEGPSLEISAPLMHHDRKSLAAWVEKHNNNSGREAACYVEEEYRGKRLETADLAPRIRDKLWLRRNIWNRLPLLIRPAFYFIYRFIFSLGFLEGKAGFIYCFLHAFLYQSMIDVKILECLRAREHA